MRSNVNIGNHPVHPMLVLLPAGAWITSLVLDVVFMTTHTTFWFEASMWVMAIGIVGALLAAVAGFFDLFTLPMTNEPKSIGIEHMSMNLVITILYVINFAAFRLPIWLSPAQAVVPASVAAWGFILNLVSVVLLGISGWLGGEMVYRYGIAVPKETMDHAAQYEAPLVGRRTAEAGALGGERKHKDDEEE